MLKNLVLAVSGDFRENKTDLRTGNESETQTDFQCLGSVQEIGEVKVHDIVAGDNVGIQFLEERSPFLQ